MTGPGGRAGRCLVALARRGDDEVLVVGFSVGSMLAVSLLARRKR